MQVASRTTNGGIEHERQRQVEKRRPNSGATRAPSLAPVEARVGEKDGDSAYQQREGADRGDPVGDAHDSGVPRRVGYFRSSGTDGEVWKLDGFRHSYGDGC